MRTKRKIAREILEQMRAVYVHINSVDQSPDYWDAYDYSYGHYNGLRDAYQALTGQSEPGITRGIEEWYRASEEFQVELEDTEPFDTITMWREEIGEIDT